MNRKKEKSDLVFKLGMLLGPLIEYTKSTEKYGVEIIKRLGAKFFVDCPKLEKEFLDFTRTEDGHFYRIEHNKLHRLFHRVKDTVEEYLLDPTVLNEAFEEYKKRIIEVILSIPVSIDSEILEAHTPFSTYYIIKDLCQTVREKLIWVDRYFVDSQYYRYLRDVPIDVKVFLITWPESKRVKGKKDKIIFDAFMDLSKLYSNERGSTNFSLLTNINIHDRWVRFDDDIYAFGGSVKDASDFCGFTLSKLKPSSENVEKIEKLISEGTKIKF